MRIKIFETYKNVYKFVFFQIEEFLFQRFVLINEIICCGFALSLRLFLLFHIFLLHFFLFIIFCNTHLFLFI